MIAERIIWAYHDAWRRQRERIVMWIAWHLPRWLVMWCYIRVCANATTGTEFGNTIPDHLNIMECLRRWDHVER